MVIASTKSSNKNNLKETMIIFLIGILALISLDYTSLSHIYESPSLYQIFYKKGEIIRALYFVLLGIGCFYSSKAKSQFSPKSVVLSNQVKIALFIISFVCIAALIGITGFTPSVIKFLYPVLFLIGNFSVGALILNYKNDPAIPKTNETILGAESVKSTKDYAVVLATWNGVVNIPNIFRSVLGIGGAGAGKTASLIEPILYHVRKLDMAGLIYDFKFPTLSNVAYSCFKNFEPTNVKFYPVSFTENSKSYRFNVIDPRLLESQTHVEEYSISLYYNLDKDAIKNSGGKFFSDSAAGLLKAVIWFLKRKHPEYCYLPHVVNLILTADTKTLVKMIASDNETRGMVKSVQEAFEKDATDQLAGVIGTLTMQLQKINTPAINWTLSGDDFTLDLNNPYNPKFLALGSDPALRNALSPVVAMIHTVALKLMNQQGKHPSAVLIDELPTIYIPNLEDTPATARSNKLALVCATQDFSQLDTMVGKDKRSALVANLGTQFYGNLSGLETAEYVSKMIGKEYRIVESFNLGESINDSGESNSTGKSYSQQQRNILDTQTMFSLEQGVFVGKLVESQNVWFKDKLKRIQDFDTEFVFHDIEPFVEDFELTGTQIRHLEQFQQAILDNPKSVINEHMDIQNLYIMLQNKSIEFEFFQIEALKILQTKLLKERRENVLDQNFKRIQSEVQQIIDLYK
jgi:hypothetical protein